MTDAELALQRALPLLTRSPVLAGFLGMRELQALSQTNGALRTAFASSPLAFWQAALQRSVHKEYRLRLQAGSTAYREVAMLGTRGAIVRGGRLRVSSAFQPGPPPFAVPRQPTLSSMVILRKPEGAAPTFKLHRLSFADPAHRLKVSSNPHDDPSIMLQRDQPFSVAAELVTPDGNWLVSSAPSAGDQLLLWSLTEGRATATLSLAAGSQLHCLRWSPDSRLLAASFKLTRLPKSASTANNFVSVYSTAGTQLASSLASLGTAAAPPAGIWQDYYGTRWGHRWSPCSQLLAGFRGAAMVVLDARSCSAVAVLEIETLLRGAPMCGLWGNFCWKPGPAGELVVCLDTVSVQTMVCWSPATRSLRWERSAPFGACDRGPPVYGALGSAAGLITRPNGFQEVCIYLPWNVVPRPSGARSGGQLVGTGLHIHGWAPDHVEFSPDGVILAVCSTEARGQTMQDLRACVTLHLLHWRTGQQLNKVATFHDLAGMDFSSGYGQLYEMGLKALGMPELAIELAVFWASTGRAVHVGWRLLSKGTTPTSYSASLVVALDKRG